MEKCILHSDMNGFYASVECLYNPKIRMKPVIVAGDEKARHGIVLAKNEIAKAYGVKTGDTLWQAKLLCPEAVFVAPNFDRYIKMSRLAKQIYYDFTDKVESFGLDEAWLDVTESLNLFGSGKDIADKIRKRIKNELGLTVSVGVSFNKIFAKLGSDMKKPDATTVISRDDFKQKIWNLPVRDLLFVGKATDKKLNSYGIKTIGELASTDKKILQRNLGKHGATLWEYANGLDKSEVSEYNSKEPVKSIGNSVTTPKDLIDFNEVKITLGLLCESVSSRLREKDFLCRTVQIGIRTTDLIWIERQAKLSHPDRTAGELFKTAFSLFKANYSFENDLPIRSLSVKACDLEKSDYEQLTFNEISQEELNESLENTIDYLREKFGYFSVHKGIMLTDEELWENPKSHLQDV
ncbi:MAG: DNA polymerase IV [Clostridiales bacterium]|nr:DNA polymerase IV [Clostridiales bacterium]